MPQGLVPNADRLVLFKEMLESLVVGSNSELLTLQLIVNLFMPIHSSLASCKSFSAGVRLQCKCHWVFTAILEMLLGTLIPAVWATPRIPGLVLHQQVHDTCITFRGSSQNLFPNIIMQWYQCCGKLGNRCHIDAAQERPATIIGVGASMTTLTLPLVMHGPGTAPLLGETCTFRVTSLYCPVPD
ncbi:hypothetical protein EMCRGX_G024704 [Ephydatia muelleri]